MSYAAVDELIRRLGIGSPSTAQLDAAQQALDAAALEIDMWLGWDITPPASLSTEETALVATVNLDRAMEHWRPTPYGALNQGPELPAVITSRDSWYRHGRKLARLQTTWGVG